MALMRRLDSKTLFLFNIILIMGLDLNLWRVDDLYFLCDWLPRSKYVGCFIPSLPFHTPLPSGQSSIVFHYGTVYALRIARLSKSPESFPLRFLISSLLCFYYVK